MSSWDWTAVSKKYRNEPTELLSIITYNVRFSEALSAVDEVLVQTVGLLKPFPLSYVNSFQRKSLTDCLSGALRWKQIHIELFRTDSMLYKYGFHLPLHSLDWYNCILVTNLIWFCEFWMLTCFNSCWSYIWIRHKKYTEPYYRSYRLIRLLNRIN